MKKSILMLSFLLLNVISYAQLNSEGWTILNPSSADRFIYVSASSGNDSTAEIYTSSSSEIGADPIHPSGTVKAYQTIAAAAANISANDAIWILLKRGDVFYETLARGASIGQSATRPIVFTSYGDSLESPLLKTGTENAINYCCGTTRNLSIIGLSFYAHTRNPSDPDYINGEGENTGFNFYTNGAGSLENILIEGCTFRFYTGNVIQGDGPILNIKLRRNMIFDNYSISKHSQGLYTANLDSFLLEENIFDHNGWYRQSNSGGPSQGQGTIYNHNTYFAESQNTTFTGNSFHRPSSIGTKWTSNSATTKVENITITNNLYNDCEVALSVGGNDRVAQYRWQNIKINENVIVSGGMSRPTNRSLAYGVEIENWDGGIVENNYILHQNNPSFLGFGISFNGDSKDVTIKRNIIYNIQGADGISSGLNSGNPGYNFPSDLINIKIEDNEMNLNLSANTHFSRISQTNPDISYSNNKFKNTNGGTNSLFRIGGTHYNFANWSNVASDSGSQIISSFNYSEPERSLDMYITDILGLANRDAFYVELRNQSYLNWRPEYTAININAWIKEGFNQDEIILSNGNFDTDEHSLIIGPNPGKGVAFISASKDLDRYEVFSSSGQKIKEGSFLNEKEIDLSNMSAAMYIIKIYDTKNNLLSTEKYIKE